MGIQLTFVTNIKGHKILRTPRKWLLTGFVALVATIAKAAPPPAPTISVPTVTTVIRISGPTLIAFAVSGAFRDGSDNYVAADDFAYSLKHATPELERAGISVRQVAVASFRVTDGHWTRVFRATRTPPVFGYYLVSPHRTPRVLYGVFTNADLVSQAARYFGIAFRSATDHPIFRNRSRTYAAHERVGLTNQ